MKTIKIILGASIALLALVACDKKQEPAVQPQESTEIVKETPQNTPKNEEKKNEEKKKEEKKKEEKEKPPAKDILALKSLGLKPLEIDPTALPPLPEPADPSNNIGLDTALERWNAKWKLPEGANPNDAPLVGIPPEVITWHIIWAYGKPSSIVLGDRTYIPNWSSREYDSDPWWKGRPYIPITLNCKEEDYISGYSTFFVPYEQRKQPLFEQLNRMHGVQIGNAALQSYMPMPYDLRHMRIAHNGVDISPLFSIRYKDYKEVTRSGDYSKWYWRDVRISDVGMDVLDWIFDGYFHIYPLTKDYPRFTIIFILKDGTILSREVEHIIQ